MHYPSKLIENAVQEISKLPGIGKKSAMRLVLHLLKQDENYTSRFTQALNDLRSKTTYCTQCHNISDNTLCQICTSAYRDESVVCVVEDTRDVIAIENTGQFTGQFHVLGGVIAPLQGIGPETLKIESLVKRVNSGAIKEIILALSPTMEGDTTCYYLAKKLKAYPIRISSIARGIPVGGELEFADEITLGRSIVARTLFHYE